MATEVTGELEKPKMATDTRTYHQLIGFHQYQGEVGEWAKTTFPQATGKSTAIHILREAVELLIAEMVAAEDFANTDRQRAEIIRTVHETSRGQLLKTLKDDGMGNENPVEEAADIALILMAYCHAKGISLAGAIVQKHEIAKGRAYGEPDAQGVAEHVR